MADKIDSNPFRIIASDTSEHEVQFDSSILKNIDGPIVVAGEVTTGTITFSVGKAIVSNQSGAYAAASNKSFIFTLPTGVNSFRYKATAVSDAFNGAI